jgi:hypothetical protein
MESSGHSRASSLLTVNIGGCIDRFNYCSLFVEFSSRSMECS